jgi:hypothetical protein
MQFENLVTQIFQSQLRNCSKSPQKLALQFWYNHFFTLGLASSSKVNKGARPLMDLKEDWKA